MEKQQGYILRNNALFSKFCAKENKLFGCQDLYGCRIGCPLWRAREVEYLYNEKGMTIGEAHKATIRERLSKREVAEALRPLFENPNTKATVSLAELIRVLEMAKILMDEE
jgi:hypothetical protein